MNKLQTRILIKEDLDVIEPDQLLTSNNKPLMYVENQDGLEKLIRGCDVVVYSNDKEIQNCLCCKNGNNGWVEFIDLDLNRKKIKGDIKVYLCVNFQRGEKPPKIDITLSDFELTRK